MEDLLDAALAEQGFTKVDSETGQPKNAPVQPPAGEQPPPVVIPGEEKKIETPAPTPGAFDESKWLNEKFAGKFKTFDELQTSVKERDDLHTKYSDIEKRHKDLETEFAEAKPVNDYIKGLNKFMKDGGDPAIYNKLQSVDIEKMNDREALVMQMRWKKGLSRADAEFKVDRKYKLLPSSETDPDTGKPFPVDENDPEVREARIDYKSDSLDAKEFLRKYKTEQLVPPGEAQAKQKEQEQLVRMNEWKPRMGEVMNGLKKIDVPYDGESIPFDVPQETLNQLSDYMTAVIEGSQFKPDADGISAVTQLLMREILFSNQEAIAKTLLSKRDEKWKNEVHHPSGLKEQQDGGKSNQPDDRDTLIAKMIAESEGRVYRP